ncbi:MAG: alkyl sulfatase dimerization domain-containing protein [bacterium]
MKKTILHEKKQIRIIPGLLLFFILILTGCHQDTPAPGPDADLQGHTAPTAATIKANSEFGAELSLDDQHDFENARKGLIARDEDLIVKNAAGEFIWNQPAYAFMTGEAPASVNPSLWRQGKLNNIHGLFKVTKGLFQLRGHDLANMTIIQGEKGWIIVDPLTAEETATRALKLARKHLGDQPVTAIIFTHSHIDHFGGVRGIMSAEEARAKKIRIIAPKGFMAEATSENIIAGIAMGRRSMFMYGKNLARSERGHIGSGLGKGPAYGMFGILEPNEIIDHTGQEKVIDGVRFIFQYAPETEAPTELTFYLPDLKAFCGAEIVSRHMHNLYTLRGTKIRNALKWSTAIDDMINQFGEADIYFGSHHWPVWGNQEIIDFLKKQRDLYKYIHDQTVRLFNEGNTPIEIAEQLELPESLRTPFFNRGYYGSLRHNARAVYQAYLGWYDGNPASLNPLPPAESGKRYVEMMGGAAAMLEKAQVYFDQGEYRWVAQLLNHLVFAEPDNKQARALLARTYDQLGYQAESAPWRDVYLTGAYELRHGSPEKGLDMAILKGVLEKTPIPYFFDSMAVRLNGLKAEGMTTMVNVVFTDLNESHELKLENSVLHHRRARPGSQPDVVIRVTHDLFIRMLVGQVGIKETVFSDNLSVEGSKLDLIRFLLLFEKPSTAFNIVTP